MIICTRCLKEADSVYRHISICKPCNDLITAENTVYCNHCQSAKKQIDMARKWLCKSCDSDKRTERYARDPEYRTKQRACVAAWRARNPEAVASYLKAWQERNKDGRRAYQRNAAYKARESARRKARYANDPEYRERRKADARERWPFRAYKRRLVGRAPERKERS